MATARASTSTTYTPPTEARLDPPAAFGGRTADPGSLGRGEGSIPVADALAFLQHGRTPVTVLRYVRWGSGAPSGPERLPAMERTVSAAIAVLEQAQAEARQRGEAQPQVDIAQLVASVPLPAGLDVDALLQGLVAAVDEWDWGDGYHVVGPPDPPPGDMDTVVRFLVDPRTPRLLGRHVTWVAEPAGETRPECLARMLRGLPAWSSDCVRRLAQRSRLGARCFGDVAFGEAMERAWREWHADTSDAVVTSATPPVPRR